jgi:hypothetical protein
MMMTTVLQLTPTPALHSALEDKAEYMDMQARSEADGAAQTIRRKV